jgi:hypothetical protein
VRRQRRKPGLAKTRALPLVRRRHVELWQSADYRWRELFETADVMSEGAPREEADGAVYYGSTSILLPLASRGGSIPDEHVQDVIRALAGDPHARLRAVRIACLEAQLRALGPIGRVRAELVVHSDLRGIRIDVEVEARVFPEGMRGTPGPRKTEGLALARRKRSAKK